MLPRHCAPAAASTAWRRAGKVDRTAELAERTRAMMAVAARLKQLSHRYDLAVLVTNQVTDKPAAAIDRHRLAPWESDASLAHGSLHEGLRLPALGLSWANCVNTRLLLSRRTRSAALPAPPHAVPSTAMPLGLPPGAQEPTGDAPTGVASIGMQPAVGEDGCAEQTVRKLAVCWSPRLPYTSCQFEVRHDGVHGVDET